MGTWRSDKALRRLRWRKTTSFHRHSQVMVCRPTTKLSPIEGKMKTWLWMIRGFWKFWWRCNNGGKMCVQQTRLRWFQWRRKVKQRSTKNESLYRRSTWSTKDIKKIFVSERYFDIFSLLDVHMQRKELWKEY